MNFTFSLPLFLQRFASTNIYSIKVFTSTKNHKQATTQFGVDVLIFFFFFFAVLQKSTRMEPRTLHMLGECSTLSYIPVLARFHP
jgi:carboxypeptidase C (cathepsin A)